MTWIAGLLVALGVVVVLWSIVVGRDRLRESWPGTDEDWRLIARLL